MLDPRIQKKGGFGAFVAHEQENTDVREAAEQAEANAAAATKPGAATENATGAPARGTPRH